MAEHFVVLLVALLCLVTTSSCEDSFDTCREDHRKNPFLPSPPFRFNTKQGTTIKTIRVSCDLSRQNTVGKGFHTYDITRVVSNFVAPKVDNASLVMVNLFFWCYWPIEVRFENSRHIVYNNILLFVRFYRCTTTTQTLLVLANATDFRGFDASSPFSLRLEERKETIATGLEEIAYATLSMNDIKQIAGVLSNTHKVLSNLAKLTVSTSQSSHNVKQISTDQWRLTMPNLQYLDLSLSGLTKPPQFPWNNSTLPIFRELRRAERDDVPQNMYIRGLDLSRNNIKDLSSYEFRGFLHKLILRYNGLMMIGPTCFHGLQGIQSIDLSGNVLTSLPAKLFHGLTSLLHIDLGNNRISAINQTLFHGLKNIKRIYLNDNKLSYIEEGLFHTLDKLEVLRLDSNEIKTIRGNPFSPYSPLHRLDLQNNDLASFPSWIFCLKKIKQIDLSKNQITLPDLNWTRKCVNGTDIVQFLQASEIKLTGNPLACDCNMAAIFKRISPALEKNPDIKSRLFSWSCDWPHGLKGKSFLHINRTYQWMEKVKNCPADCSCSPRRCSDGNITIDCSSRSLKEIPNAMPQGRIELNLINNEIREIGSYYYLENVTALKLTNNKIDQLQDSVLPLLKHVKTLLLNSNLLTSLPEEIKNLNFTRMELSGNIFKCDCDTKWIPYWLLKNKENIIDYDKVLCSSGQSDLRAKPMYHLTDNMFICPTATPFPFPAINEAPSTNNSPHLIIAITVVSVVCGLLLLTVMTGILLYKYKGEIKVFMFTRFNWHPFDRLDDSDPNKIYDAFISYSGEDYQWVVNTLQKGLENHNPPYKLCLHHRDFRVGALIQENIFNSVDHSKRMIMVLSSNFAKSEWCLLEFRFAHQKVLQDRINYLIIILFDDVDMAEVDEEIKLYMRTNTYLKVSDEWFWKKLFYAMPVCSTNESVEESVTDGQTMPLTQ